MHWIARLAIRIGVLGLLLGLAACRHTDPCPYGAEGRGFDNIIFFHVTSTDRITPYSIQLKSRGLMDSTDQFSNYLMGYFLYNDSLIPYRFFDGSSDGSEVFMRWNHEFLHPNNPRWEKERWYRYGDTITDTLLVRFVYDCPEQTDTFFVSYIPEPDPNPECPSRERVSWVSYSVRHKSVYGEYLLVRRRMEPVLPRPDSVEVVDYLNVSLPCEP